MISREERATYARYLRSEAMRQETLAGCDAVGWHVFEFNSSVCPRCNRTYDEIGEENLGVNNGN